ncbi:MAG TPA: RNase adapter RapZ [Acidobacteriota bacterium]|nr:RNase adapter RapZ [Acidobacteriota bacterium]HQO20583.1 RNase adapter RapZ [Acidobacteriota bacterium]HQQ47580.1 RNase adapter RapZ [Acidobacteriota bacterium]
MTPKTILIVTGMSGAGKTQVINTLQDQGFYCIDNLPLILFSKFLELLEAPHDELGSHIALGLDLREANLDLRFPEVLASLRKSSHLVKIIFVDAEDAVLIRRFSETRRPHPLSPKGSVEEGIAVERSKMTYIREKSDWTIDTGPLNVHQLRELVVRKLEGLTSENRMVVNIVSFGFSKGIPAESCLVLDVRFLPNPYFVPELKDNDGRNGLVSSYVLDNDEGKTFLGQAENFLDFLLPRFRKEGKSYLTLAVGCTGGRHRSVAVAERLFRYLSAKGAYQMNVIHRELKE